MTRLHTTTFQRAAEGQRGNPPENNTPAADVVRGQLRSAKFGWRSLVLLAAIVAAGCSSSSLEFEAQSEFSHIRVRRQGDVRTLIFVQDDGHESVESRVHIKQPHRLLSKYTRFMFSSYLFRPHQQRVLIIGLGGGAMVHFLKHYDPQLKVDVVEIDPTVVKVAERYFDVRSSGNVNIVTADAMDYLLETAERYDVIYMDAFLPKSAGTDTSGVPLRLKTQQFYGQVQQQLTPGGLMVFNVIARDSFDEDVLAIRNAFPNIFVFDIPRATNFVVVGCTSQPPSMSQLLETAKTVDSQFNADFSFEQLLDRLDHE